MFADRKNIAANAVLAAVCVFLVLNCYEDVAPGSIGQGFFEELKNPEESFHALNDIDRLYAELPPNENALVTFRNFGPENEELAERVYYRSNYAAYPSKVFAVSPDAVVNHGRDILQSVFEPDQEWLDQHRISRVIVYEQKPDGRITAVLSTRELR